MSWGPSHQQEHHDRWRWAKRAGWTVWFIVLVFSSNDAFGDAWFFIGGLIIIWRLVRFVRRHHGPWLTWPTWLPQRRADVPDPAQVRAMGVGVHLGTDARGRMRIARPERAVLILGPPRSGKTTGVIIPTLLSHPGPAICTSTKPDVMNTTATARRNAGTVWQFDPTGSTIPPEGVQSLRWSPVLCAGDWDGALLMARAMVNGAHVGSGTTDQNHWTRRAQALLAPLLHAAALAGRQIDDVVGWVARHELDQPGALLTEHDAVTLAAGQLIGLQNTDGRERSSIFSAAADALDAYTSQAALVAATQPNFFPGRFVTSTDTIYIHAPAEHQHLAAPLVCGLLAEIRRATYQHHRDHTLRTPVLFALDEVANIAPIAELPQIASEGSSQGILLLAALQDLSQARVRWGAAADGFLTLFGTKLLLTGIADQKTLDAVSTMLGEYDRQVISHTAPNTSFLGELFTPGHPQRPSTTRSTQRTRRLSPGDIAQIPAGKALHLDGTRWELITLTPAHTTEPWRTLTTTPAQ